MILSAQQVQAYDQVMAWMKNPQDKRFVLAGYAGTGKTTLAKQIADAIGMDNVYFCAYTGKAANILREKGCMNSSTIHGAIYQLIDSDDGEPRFILNMDSDLKYAKLVIVDEYSMLPEEVREDLEHLSKKILYLGDEFQLPPVNGDCKLKPDFFMEEIHRQALENPIIRFATDVREGRSLKFCNLPEFTYGARKDIDREVYTQADQIIVGYNKTRVSWNQRFRKIHGFEGLYPVKGDKIICTKNNHEKALFNGMIGLCQNNAKEIDNDVIELSFEKRRHIEVWSGNFKGIAGQPPRHLFGLERFDYAYAITCHKAQGSEYDHALIYEQPIGSDAVERRRWMYTAITRGKERVTLVKP